MAREIVLDTETTGLDPRTGHRLIEIACIELDDLMPTGRHFHRYVDPEREVDPDAERVHGISATFLAGKPRFADIEVVEAFLSFIADAPLVAHNAPFDRGFVNHELERTGRGALPAERWIDTLPLAQKRFPGGRNSLDALCKRFAISLMDRDRHGALVDARLLAGVYLELKGGRERRLDLDVLTAGDNAVAMIRSVYGERPRPLTPRLTDLERTAHETFIAAELRGEVVWERFARGA